MATIGQILGYPEIGTIRFEEKDQNITFTGAGWTTYNHSAYSGGSRYQCVRTTINPSFKFNFTGSKITLVSSTYVDYSANIQVKIDGTILGNYSQKISSGNKVVFFTIDNLEDEEHFIEVTKTTQGVYPTDFNLDAVDILAGEKLLPYNEKITKPKLFILHSNQYYYRDYSSWKTLSISPTEEEITNLGMDNINENQILEFISIYGKEWDVCCWDIDDSLFSANYEATPQPQILTAKNSIQLTGVESAIFTWTATGDSKVALSVNDGVSYHAFKNGIWEDVTNDMPNAMSASDYSNLTWEQYKLLAVDSNFLKHQYYIPDNSTVDDILITTSLLGTNKIANTSDYILNYDQSKKKIVINIKKSGTYFANVLDT